MLLEKTMVYPIRWDNLNKETQDEMFNAFCTALKEDREVREYLFEVCGSDEFDMDRADADRMSEHIEGSVEFACSKFKDSILVRITL